jgi:hypothetical protein
MTWVYSFLIAVITAILAATGAGFIGAACVGWYRVSTREGGDASFVLGFILLGAFCGFVGGFVLSRFFASTFLSSLLTAAGILLLLEGIIALVAWGLADIPPKINGHELDLVVEIRLPVGANQPPVLEGKQFIEFESGGKGTIPRAQEIGTLDVAKAQLVDGRWIVPGAVRIFTTREYRFLTVVLSEKDATGFQLIFPGHPGPQYEQWSNWQPDTGRTNPWPSTRTSYRYRIQERIPVVDVPPPDPFLALTSESPLKNWMAFSDAYGRDPARQALIDQQAKTRITELADLLRSSNSEESGPAFSLVSRLNLADLQILQALHDVAASIQDQLKVFNKMPAQDPGYADAANVPMMRFNEWGNCWLLFYRTNPAEGRPPVDAILALATAGHPDEPHMMALIQNAQYMQSQFSK